MKRLRLSVLLMLLPAFASMPVLGADDDTPRDVNTIKVQAVSEFVASNKDAVIIDVRTPQEYELSHVPGAVNINILDDSFTEIAGQLDSKKTYIVYCTKNPAGGRSMTALAKMQEMGFKELISLEGGHVAWTEAELPMSTLEEE